MTCRFDFPVDCIFNCIPIYRTREKLGQNSQNQIAKSGSIRDCDSKIRGEDHTDTK